ncbi:hypothetical protein AHF37_09860 [Paragonimus kellicotti]|nr:hypothetical protein AHF37_09860 [Paragonimus kellicotti]
MLLPMALTETPVSRPRVALVIVSVVLRHAGRITHTSAFLYGGSDSTLYQESLLNGLGLTGQPKQFTLSTPSQCSMFTSAEVEFDEESVDSKYIVHMTRVWSAKS